MFLSLKPKLSIKLISPFQFWLGVVLAVLFALSFYHFSLFCNAYFPAGRMVGGYWYEEGSYHYYLNTYFIAAVSCVLAFALCFLIWFGGVTNFKTVWKKVVWHTALLWFWLILLLLGRAAVYRFFFLPYFINPYEFDSYLVGVDLIAILLPLVFFLNLWNPILAGYRAQRFFYASLLLFFLASVCLVLINPFPMNYESTLYRALHYQEVQQFEVALAEAGQKGIVLKDETQKLLLNKQSEAALDQARELKLEFTRGTTPGREQIFQEYWLVQSTKYHALGDSDKPEENWPFALPEDVVRHLNGTTDPIRRYYLGKILYKYKEIFDKKENWLDDMNFEEFNPRHNYYRREFKGIGKQVRNSDATLQEVK